MFSLIITIFAIALVIFLAIVTVYYGGQAFMANAAKVTAETLINQSVQIASARQLAIAQGRALPTGPAVDLPTDLLKSMPVPPASAYVSGEPSSGDWEYYVPGTSTHFGITTKITKRACMAVNAQQGFIGIPAAWDGTSAIQCFGPSDSGYTYLYQPTGTTQQQNDAVLQHAIDQAKPTVPSVTPGYPRECPNGESITEGVCDGSTTPPKPTGFWVITAQASGTYTTSLQSNGYSTTCPAGAVDPTSSSAVPAPSKAGEPFSLDGLVEMEWQLPPDYGSSFQAPLTRTWCIPANEADVLDRVADSGHMGGLNSVSQTVMPASMQTDPESYTMSFNQTTLLTAGGKQWVLLASTFEADTDNKTTGDSLYMVGHKVAIGQVPTATSTYFVNSPIANYNGASYQNTAGTLTFAPAQPPCRPLATHAPLGTGGTIVTLLGGETGMMLKQDGSVWVTGAGYEGRLGDCTWDDRLTWTRVATGATKIAESNGGRFFFKADGTVWGTGDLSFYAGDWWEVSLFTQIPLLTGVADMKYGFVKLSDGTLWQHGKSFYNTDSTIDYTQPVKVATNVLDWEDGAGEFYVIKTDHSLWRIAYSNAATSKIADNVASVSGNDGGYVYITTDGSVYARGSDTGRCNIWGQNGVTWQYNTPTQIAQSVGPAVKVLTDHNYTMVLGADGRLWGAGCPGQYNSRFGDGTMNGRATFSPMATNVSTFTPQFVVDPSGKLYGFGANYIGQLGNGTYNDSEVFIPIAY